MDKQINIGVNKQSYDSAMRSVSDDSRKLATDMIRSAREQELSSKNVLINLREQIKLRKELNDLTYTENVRDVQKARAFGESTPKEYRARMFELRDTKREEDRTIRELHNIVNAVETTSKKEINEDKKQSEKEIDALKSSGNLGKGKDEIENLKQIYKDSILKSKREDEQSSINMNPMSAFGMGQQLGGGGNIMSMMGMIGGMGILKFLTNPYVAGAALLGGATLGAEQSQLNTTRNLQKVLGNATSTSGKDIATKRLWDKGWVGMGIDPYESINIEAGITRAYGGRRVSNEDLLHSVAITQSRDISTSMMEDLYGTSRYSRKKGDNPLQLVSDLEGFLKKIERPMSQLPELMNQYLQTSNQILMSQGSVNSQGVKNLIGGITSSYDVEGVNVGRYTRAAQFLGGTENKIAGMSHLQIRAAREALGGDPSKWQVDRLRTDPSHPEYQKYYKILTDQLMKMRGGGEGGKWTMLNAFGGTLGMADIDRISNMPYKPSNLSGGAPLNELYSQQAKDMTSTSEVALKEIAVDLKKVVRIIQSMVTFEGARWKEKLFQ